MEIRPGLVVRASRTEVFEKVLQSKLLASAAEQLAPGRTVRLNGLWGSCGAFVAAVLGKITARPVLFLTMSPDSADDVADDVEVLTGSTAQIFPAWEETLGVDHVSDEVTGERLRLCGLLTRRPDHRQESVDFIVAPIMALLQPVPTPQVLDEGRFRLQVGGQLDLRQLIEWLVQAQFERVDQVDQPGQFAHRGGIVDIFPPGLSQAVRIEFFGDQIESVRQFDLDTQRSVGKIDFCDLVSLAAGRDIQEAASLLDYLPPDCIVCMVEPVELLQLARDIHRRISFAAQEGSVVPGGGVFEPDDIFGAISARCALEIYTFSTRGLSGSIDLRVKSLQRVSTNTADALCELETLSATCDVWIYCENAAEQERFGKLLQSSHPSLAQRAHVNIGHVGGGFHWPTEHLVVVGHHELYHRYARRRRIRRLRAGRPIESMLDLDEGQYVVHVGHGIARFEGLRRIEQNGRTEEYLTLRFARGAVLHVPAAQINLVQRYVGTRKVRPTLSSLGSSSWTRQKQRVGEAVRDLAAEMLRIQAMRQAMAGQSYPDMTDWQRQFRDEFLYSDTEDQSRTMDQIDSDMVASSPMDRLVCGDVGFGKTELAMRAAFKVAEAGRQVAVLVPTTVLAEQHMRTFQERLADYPFRVEMISRYRTAGEQKQIIKDLVLGRIDILIGTHRILSPDVRFADLGLAIIDEEQRFGVEHKEHLKHMRASVDVLTLTATPIPRTLHMALLGLRDISSLATPPMDRRAIVTEVCRHDERQIRKAILRELNRQGQVFFVHNRVLDIHLLAERIRQLVPEARVDLAHGQMHEGELEGAMLRFVRQDTDVLVCTTIIESGLDIPTVNTIIVHEADRFGLSQLHQLRGRVGRYKHRAYCYLLLPESRSVSPVAAKRLKAIEEFSDLGAGFQIAMRDLELRGAGNILGKAQSGHIAMVGYELYCQLLEQAVGDMSGKPVVERRRVHVELGMDCYIPRSYISSERQRMEIYRRLARCASNRDIRQLVADLVDAYGPVPPAVETLVDIAEIRVRAGQLGIESIIRMDPDLVFSVKDLARVGSLFEGAAGSVRLPDKSTVHWRPPPAYCEGPTLLRVLLKRLSDASSEV